MRPTVFLDRDGVLNKDHEYVYKPDAIVIPPFAAAGCQKLQQAGFQLVVITNQSGVARGLFTEADVDVFNLALAQLYLDNYQVRFCGFYVCPHHPQGAVAAYAQDCGCRKPKIGLLERAAREHPVDWQRSFLIGDKSSDVTCGINAGIAAIQITTGQYDRAPDATFHAGDLVAAADFISQRLSSSATRS